MHRADATSFLLVVLSLCSQFLAHNIRPVEYTYLYVPHLCLSSGNRRMIVAVDHLTRGAETAALRARDVTPYFVHHFILSCDAPLELPS